MLPAVGAAQWFQTLVPFKELGEITNEHKGLKFTEGYKRKEIRKHVKRRQKTYPACNSRSLEDLGRQWS